MVLPILHHPRVLGAIFKTARETHPQGHPKGINSFSAAPLEKQIGLQTRIAFGYGYAQKEIDQ